MKVILSTFGPLHLIKSAEYLSERVDIKVIQGWIPKWWNKWILALASRLVGRDLFKAFKRRTPVCLEGRNTSIAFAEFYMWACRLFRLSSPLKYLDTASQIYGWQSKHHLGDADIYHVRSGSGFCGALEKARAKGMKVLVDHSIAHPAFMEQQLSREYEKNGVLFDLGLSNPFWAHIVEECRKGDAVLVNSQFVKDTFVANGFNADKVKVVLQGVRPDFFGIKQQYEIKEGVFRILFTGGFGFRKGAEYILQALVELDKEQFPYEFVCVGDSSEAEALIQKYSPKHLSRVNTIPQEELKYYLSSFDVYLFPSLCEGCASSGMEALAAGMPVIATRESGLPIEDHVDGIIIPSKESQSIVSTIKELVADKELRESLGVYAARKIRENYTWEKYAENVVRIYKELITV